MRTRDAILLGFLLPAWLLRWAVGVLEDACEAWDDETAAA